MTTANQSTNLSEQLLTWWGRHSSRIRLILRLSISGIVVVAAFWWFVLSPVKVSVYTVSKGSVVAEVLGTGTLEARVSATIGPKISGLITRISGDQGDSVTAGSTLVELESTDLAQLVALAEAELAATSAGLDRLRADGARAEAVLSQATLSYERQLSLAASNATSSQEIDLAREALAIAEAERARAAAALLEGQRYVAAAERNLDYQRARLHDTTIESPFDGLVIRRDRDEGDVVTAGSSVLQVVSLDEMWVTAWVDETELARLAPQLPVRIVFRSEPENEYPGIVARIGREADRETREVVVDVRVEALPAAWAVGQRAEVYFRVAGVEDVVVLPAGLVLLREGRSGVMIDDDGRARWREIGTGLRGTEFIEITTGLKPGDIVISPLKSGGMIREGRRVDRQ